MIAVLATILSAPTPVLAANRCVPGPAPGVEWCEAELSAKRLVHVPAIQEASQWCWAASIQMAFRYFGFNVSQTRIVKETFGAIQNVPSGAQGLTQPLSRNWAADDGRAFRSSASVTNMSGWERQVDNRIAVEALREDRPLVVGTQGHAMLLVGLAYEQVQGRVTRILRARVFDPWPGRGLRLLAPAEMTPTYLAVVNVAMLSTAPLQAPALRLTRPQQVDNLCQFVTAVTDGMPTGLSGLRNENTIKRSGNETQYQGLLRLKELPDCVSFHRETKNGRKSSYVCESRRFPNFEDMGTLYKELEAKLDRCVEDDQEVWARDDPEGHLSASLAFVGMGWRSSEELHLDITKFFNIQRQEWWVSFTAWKHLDKP